METFRHKKKTSTNTMPNANHDYDIGSCDDADIVMDYESCFDTDFLMQTERLCESFCHVQPDSCACPHATSTEEKLRVLDMFGRMYERQRKRRAKR